mgnify:CR=1 FL=1
MGNEAEDINAKYDKLQMENEGLYPESKSPEITLADCGKYKSLTIPHKADTAYLGHGYFRYIGKYPPQIVSFLLNQYNISGPIADTMCGGGTTLIEAKLRGIDVDGSDINPISRLICEAVTQPLKPEYLDKHVKEFIKFLDVNLSVDPLFIHRRKTSTPIKLKYCQEYFDDQTLCDIACYQKQSMEYPESIQKLFNLTLFAILRRVSRANIKKMNLEIDDTKLNQETVLKAATKHLQLIRDLNRDYYKWQSKSKVKIYAENAEKVSLKANHYEAVFLHPPYLTNTAFSEFTQLQLALVNINHKDVWKQELRCRGSFMHEPNGLKKYLIGWSKIMQEAYRILKPGGYLFTVVGDGQIDFVRIPIGAITEEFGTDLGLKFIDRYIHMLNNHTGQTQSRKMKGQHIAVFQK